MIQDSNSVRMLIYRTKMNSSSSPPFCCAKTNPSLKSMDSFHRPFKIKLKSSSYCMKSSSIFWSSSSSIFCSNYPIHRIIFLIFFSILLLYRCVNSQSLLSSQSSSSSSSSSLSSSSCDVRQCFGTSNGGDNRLDRKSCQEIGQIYQCLRQTLNPKACRGNLEYHTSIVLINKKKSKCRTSAWSSYDSAAAASLSGPNASSHIPQVKSGSTFSQNRIQQSNSHQQSHRLAPYSQPSLNLPAVLPGGGGSAESLVFSSSLYSSKPAYHQYCLSAAYNYTINVTIVPNFIIKNPTVPTATIVQSNPEVIMPAKEEEAPDNEFPVKPKRKHRKERVRRQAPLGLSSPVAAAVSGGSPLPALIYKPPQPMTPSLTCIIFGDPHIRTFDSRYQTCNCVGARSLIEHPLFDVQITNTRLQEQFNATGVTKVTVLVRRFGPCAIGNELIYETDSLATNLPSSTFTDGSTYNFNNLIFITSSSQNKVITVHLDHIGVRVYISQFSHTKFLNVVIKFRTANLKTVKQNLILDAISSISLCKSGCHPRELINIEHELKRAGVDTAVIESKRNRLELATSIGQTDDNSIVDQQKSSNLHEESYDDEDFFEDEDEDQEGDYDEDDDSEGDSQDSAAGHRRRTRKDANLAEMIDKHYRRQQRRLERKRQKEEAAAAAKARTSATDNKTEVEDPSGQTRNAKRNLLRSAIFQQNRHNQPPSPYSLQSIPYDILASLSSTNFGTNGGGVSSGVGGSQTNNRKSSSLLASIAAPPPSIDDHQLLPQILPQPTITDECAEMIGYYRLTCLYDSVLKGIVSIDPHKFARSFDEPRFVITSDTESMNGTSTGATAASAPSISYQTVPSVCGLLLLLTVTIFYNRP